MVKHRFDNVRLHTNVGHARRDRAADVVNHPVAHTGAFVENVLRICPGRELEHCVTSARHLREKRPRCRRQRDNVRPLVLGAVTGEIDGVGADFTPAQPGNLAPSLAGKNQQLDDCAIGALGGVPDTPQLVSGENSIARPLLTLVRVGDRV